MKKIKSRHRRTNDGHTYSITTVPIIRDPIHVLLIRCPVCGIHSAEIVTKEGRSYWQCKACFEEGQQN